MDGNGCTQYLPLNAMELSCPIQTWVSQQFVNRSQLFPFTASQSPFMSMGSMYKEHMKVDSPCPCGEKKNGHEMCKSTKKHALLVKKSKQKGT